MYLRAKSAYLLLLHGQRNSGGRKRELERADLPLDAEMDCIEAALRALDFARYYEYQKFTTCIQSHEKSYYIKQKLTKKAYKH